MRRTWLGTLAVGLAGVAIGFLLRDTTQASAASAAGAPIGVFSVTEQLGQTIAQIERSYVDPVERTRLLNGAIRGMVNELDPHSSFMTEPEYKAFQEESEGKFAGIGVELDTRDGVLLVVAPIEGSPAERAGIRSGDRIVSIDDVDVTAHPFERVARRMRGVPGTKVKLGIVRLGEKRPLSFDIVRAEIHVPSVASKLLTGNIGYLRLKQFQEGTADEFVAHVGRLRDAAKGKGTAPLAGVLIDMRANPGGFVDEATAIADECLDEGVIYTTRGRGQVLEEAKAEPGGSLVAMPIVVMVNEWTASASELLAGALRDHGRALIVGSPTFGKGSVQAIVSLPFGAGLKLTIARYYTPLGSAIQAHGLEPDLFVRTAFDPSIKREGDLEGHLTGEGKKPTPKGPNGKGPHVIDAGKDEEVPLIADVRAIPDDPRKGKDLVLNTAYQTLRDVVIPRAKRKR